MEITSSAATASSKSFQFVFILLLATAKRKRLLDELPAHGAALEVPHAAVAQARVPAGQQHPVHRPVLAHHAVLAVLLCSVRRTSRESSPLQQTVGCALFFRRGIAGRSGVVICGHEKLLKNQRNKFKIITNGNYSLTLGVIRAA